jgi:dihydroneopterin aldolase / 2-amino-4-hydroxy-6-hydroxymethyldihydropteridine diphosphokinase
MRAMGTHGLLSEERARAQPFEVDLDVQVDLRNAGRSDDLGDTADYASVGAAALAVIAGPHVDLLERLAELIARAAAAEVASSGLVATGVSVTVRKLRPPVPFEMGSVGITIHRTASDLAGSLAPAHPDPPAGPAGSDL